MIKIFTVLIFISLIQAVLGHEVKYGENTEWVPLPKYNKALGEASAKTAQKGALKFIDSLSGELKKKVLFDFDAKSRSEWSNLPASFVKRTGVSIGELSEGQRKALFDFLSVSLSEKGYKKVADIIAAEAFLTQEPQAKRIMWAPEYYWISFYGDPKKDKKWAWQLDGHHLVVNMTIDDGEVVSVSPSFIGSNPAYFEFKGKKYEVMDAMHKAGFDLFQSLSEEQKKKALLKNIPRDLSVGPGKDGHVPDVIGLKLADLSGTQKALALRTIRQWMGIQPKENMVLRMTEIEKGLEQTYFAWVGEYGVNKKAYYRIQGPSVIIELLAMKSNVGKPVGKGHYHTMYRNLSLDYGEKSSGDFE